MFFNTFYTLHCIVELQQCNIVNDKLRNRKCALKACEYVGCYFVTLYNSAFNIFVELRKSLLWGKDTTNVSLFIRFLVHISGVIAYIKEEMVNGGFLIYLKFLTHVFNSVIEQRSLVFHTRTI